MTFGNAVLLLVLSLAGLFAAARLIKQNRALRLALIILLSFTALALVCYIGLTVLFLDAARNKPPAL